MKKILIAFAIAVLCSCTSNNLPVYSHLDSLRVIALLADHPETIPGSSVTITPYISDAIGAGRALTYSASACPDPGIAAGITPTCLTNPLTVTLATSQSVTLPSVTSSYTGAVNSFVVTIPAILLASQTAENIYNGVNYLITYQLTATDGSIASAFRRIVVSQGHALNANPTLTDILVSGTSFSSMPTNVTTMTAVSSASSAETYNYQDSSGNLLTAQENLLITWFTNAGDFKYIRTDSASENSFTPGKTAPMTGHNTFVFVLRDGRGGESIIQRDF